MVGSDPRGRSLTPCVSHSYSISIIPTHLHRIGCAQSDNQIISLYIDKIAQMFTLISFQYNGQYGMAVSKMSETENISLRQSYGNLIKRHLLVKMCALLLILDCHCLLSEVKANFVYYSYPLHIFIWIGLCGFSTKRW